MNAAHRSLPNVLNRISINKQIADSYINRYSKHITMDWLIA